MSFSSADRSNRINTTSNEANRNNSIRNIKIKPKDLADNKKFAEEISEEFKYNNFWRKLKFWNKASRDRCLGTKYLKTQNLIAGNLKV